MSGLDFSDGNILYNTRMIGSVELGMLGALGCRTSSKSINFYIADPDKHTTNSWNCESLV